MNFYSKSFTLIIFVALSLFGCAQPKINIQDDISMGSVGTNATIMMEDVRPESDREYSIGSILITSDEYGIWTLGDEMFTPTALELLKKYVNRAVSRMKIQPKEIRIKLKRLKFEANHQASMIAEGSSQLGPLGVAIAETMHGKKFELEYDKTRPYVLGFIEADVVMVFPDKKVKRKSLSAYKAENFSHHMNVQGRMDAASKTLKALYTSFGQSL